MENTREMASCAIFLKEGKREVNCSVTQPRQEWEIIIQCVMIELSVRYSVKMLIRDTFQKTSHLNCFAI